MNYDGKFGTKDKEAEDTFNDIFLSSGDPAVDNVSDVLDMPVLHIDMDEISGEAKRQANIITEKLSNYFLDPVYVKKNPYIIPKISQLMDSIRRLLKMLTVNEKAQDALISSIAVNSSKGTLFSSLTSLQNAMLSIQSQLNTLIASLEDIFKEMQSNCEETFEQKDKEESEDGSIVVRGSRDFIKNINAMLSGEVQTEEMEQEIKETNI